MSVWVPRLVAIGFIVFLVVEAYLIWLPSRGPLLLPLLSPPPSPPI